MTTANTQSSTTGWRVEKSSLINAIIQLLSPDDIRAVDLALHRLENGDFASIPQVYGVRRREGEQTLWVMRAGETFRVVFTKDPTERVIRVLDIVNRNFAKQFG